MNPKIPLCIASALCGTSCIISAVNYNQNHIDATPLYEAALQLNYKSYSESGRLVNAQSQVDTMISRHGELSDLVRLDENIDSLLTTSVGDAEPSIRDIYALDGLSTDLRSVADKYDLSESRSIAIWTGCLCVGLLSWGLTMPSPSKSS